MNPRRLNQRIRRTRRGRSRAPGRDYRRTCESLEPRWVCYAPLSVEVAVGEGEASALAAPDFALLDVNLGAESSFGQITCAPFNAWGWGCPTSPYDFESWADGIDAVSEGLRTNYLAEGRTTVASIHQKYAPVGAANDPTGLNNNWTINVSRFLVEQGVGRDNRFWSLADHLSKLYPAASPEKRLVDGVLARKKGLGF